MGATGVVCGAKRAIVHTHNTNKENHWHKVTFLCTNGDLDVETNEFSMRGEKKKNTFNTKWIMAWQVTFEYFDYGPLSFSWTCNYKTSLAVISAALLRMENGNCLV